MKKICLIILLLHFLGTKAQLNINGGRIKRLDHFTSTYVQPRTIDIWLPDDFDSTKKYPVLYMQDGQMLFDSSATWTHQEWQMDETLTALIHQKKIRPCILVGIFNTGSYRHAEYYPKSPLDELPERVKNQLLHIELHDTSLSDKYLLFLTRELKPYIDKNYPTLHDPANTFIAGSSMGGLISMYAICEYPEIFGGAICMSTHWMGSLLFFDESIPISFNHYLQKHLPTPTHHKIYFDYGTATLDSNYKQWQLLVDKTMKSKGYSKRNWITREFIGAAHKESDWAKRVKIPLEFMLK